MAYASPADSHTPIGSPAPSQLFMHRVASPNHLVNSQQYADSPRSVPVEYTHYAAPTSQPTEQRYEFQNNQEMFTNDDHIYDFGPNGALPVEPQFAHPDMSQNGANGANGNFLYMVWSRSSSLTAASQRDTPTTYPDERAIRKPTPSSNDRANNVTLLRRRKRFHNGRKSGP